MEDRQEQRRLFGSAISQVQLQAEPVGGSSVQVPAKKGRRSVFERMDSGYWPLSDDQRNSGGRRNEDVARRSQPGGRRGRRRIEFYGSESEGMSRRGYNDGSVVVNRLGRRSAPYGMQGNYNGFRSQPRAHRVDDNGQNSLNEFDGVMRPQWRREGTEFSDGSRPVSRHARSQQSRSMPRNARGRWSHDLYDGPTSHPASRVFIRNLPNGCSKETLKSLFSQVGEVVVINIDKGPLTTATVGFLRRDSGKAAEERFNGTILKDSRIKVALIFDEEEKQDADNGQDDDVVMIDADSVGATSRTQEQNTDLNKGQEDTFLPNDAPRKSVFNRFED